MNIVRYLSLLVIAVLFSASVFAADASALPSNPYVSILTNADTWLAVVTLVSGLIAIWKHQQANDATAAVSTWQKVAKSLVLGVETAASLPEVAAAESKVKSVIQAKATEYGVQPVLHQLVQLLTEPAATGATPTAAQSA
jgi:hypothetical protein